VIDMSEAAFVGVDWGTSSFRLWVLSREGTALASSRSNEGMQHCTVAGFRPVLEKHLQVVAAPDALPILVCGMAGARQGWVEAQYVQTPTPLNDLHARAISVPDAGRDVRILPGLAQVSAAAPNVMRGEETQLLGAIGEGFTGLVCMPGTHCKWVAVDNGSVMQFSTFMTGELFSVIGRHSILMHAIEPGDAPTFDDPAVRRAIAVVRDDPSALMSALFSIRAGQLLGFETKAEGAAHLSGLLIGAEISAARKRYGAVDRIVLIGSGALGNLYEAALTDAGFSVSTIDAEEAVRSGLAKAAARLWEKD
jgi:2-dehydro-3-deoxygalactonokinase